MPTLPLDRIFEIWLLRGSQSWIKLPASCGLRRSAVVEYNSFPNSQAVSEDLQLKLPPWVPPDLLPLLRAWLLFVGVSTVNQTSRNGACLSLPCAMCQFRAMSAASIRACLSCLGYRAACMNNQTSLLLRAHRTHTSSIPPSTKVPPFVASLQGRTD